MNGKVSILVPVYGVEKYIERCARSLFEQSYYNIEYIFVNDCTKDKSIEILTDVLDEYPHRKAQVKIIHHKRNRGLSAARNTAVANMTGDYLWHIDSDDYVAVDAVEELVREIEKTNADVVIFGYKSVYANKTISNTIEPYNNINTYIKLLLLNSIAASMWNKFYRTSFYKEIGIMSINGIGQGEDYAVVPRILYNTSKITWFNKSLYFYNLVNQSSYSNNISLASIKSLKKADDVLYDFFKLDESYKDVVDVLHLRSMLFLIKTSKKDVYAEIINTYNGYNNIKSLSLSDKIIFFLAKNGLWSICEFLITCYRKL
ncbi:MAG: glycosyltransferase family 2 protein [Alistipes sp.]|nr:glycosyltransferase family 2 protein [Alistipes sp.]